MKSFWIGLNLIFALSLSFEALAFGNIDQNENSERGPAKVHTCRYITGDVGTIIGRGSSKNEAFADAAEQCFDRRVKLFEQVRGQAVSMDRGQDFIESCVNLQCS